jgi:hypothetical protein
MSSGNPKRDLYVQFAAVAKAIGNEHRLELLELVSQGERSVEALAVPGSPSPTPPNTSSTCGVQDWSQRGATPNLSSTASRTTQY